MTDKLTCPFCGAPLEIDNDSDMAVCMTHCCDGGCWQEIDIWKQIIAWKQSTTVLQKKLDKAMDALNELKDGHVQGSADGIKLWAQVIAETALKEIEDIRE